MAISLFMKLTPLLLLICAGAFAQQKDKPVKISDYDSIDFDWKKELFRQGDCMCPLLTPEVVQQMPHELSPYKWINKDQPIIIDDTTYRQWIKADQKFKKMYQRADSLRKVQDSTRVIKKPMVL